MSRTRLALGAVATLDAGGEAGAEEPALVARLHARADRLEELVWQERERSVKRPGAPVWASVP